jgi:hypothetical protein
MAFVAAGFAGIGVGWNEMARVTCVDCQLPYLLSSGAGGLGAIVLGVGLLVIAQIRAERMRLIRRLEPTGSIGAHRADGHPVDPGDRPGGAREDGAAAVARSLRGSRGR